MPRTTEARRGALALIVVAVAASITTLANQFAYDDFPIIVSDERVHSLAAWWRLFGDTYWPPALGRALYRPVTLLGFAVQWTLGDGAPIVFHVVNVALFVAMTLLVWRLARRVVDPWPAWIAAALFAVHPVHVEVIANAVGQSELIAGVSVVWATCIYLSARWESDDHLSWRSVAAIVGLYVAGALAKESALVLPLLLIAADVTVLSKAPNKPAVAGESHAVAVRRLYAALVLVGVGVVWLRAAVIGALAGDRPSIVLSTLPRRRAC